jgi:hypothetical protein
MRIYKESEIFEFELVDKVKDQDMCIFRLRYIINGRVKEELVKIKDNLLLTGTEKN